VSSLSATEIDQACHGYRTCSTAVDTAEIYCRMVGLLAAVTASPAPTTDQAVRVACQTGYDACIQNPSQADAMMAQATAAAQAQPCLQPTGCAATIAELDACAAQVRASSLATFVPCSEASLASVAVHPQPSFPCPNLAPGCVLLLMTPASKP
jgi:hypothetical protein